MYWDLEYVKGDIRRYRMGEKSVGEATGILDTLIKVAVLFVDGSIWDVRISVWRNRLFGVG